MCASRGRGEGFFSVLAKSATMNSEVERENIKKEERRGERGAFDPTARHKPAEACLLESEGE